MELSPCNDNQAKHTQGTMAWFPTQYSMRLHNQKNLLNSSWKCCSVRATLA